MLSRKPKKEYWKRRRKVRTTLIKWGIKKELVRNTNYKYPVGVLEKIIEATKKRNPKNLAKYFLDGLNYSKIKHGKIPL